MDRLWERMAKVWKGIADKPNLSSIAFSILAGFAGSVVLEVVSLFEGHHFYLDDVFLFWLMFSAFCVYPFTLTMVNIGSLLFLPKTEVGRKKLRCMEYITLALGLLYSVLYGIVFSGIRMDADWNISIYVYERHTPVWTGAAVTVFVLAAVGIFGYMTLSLTPFGKMTPLAMTLAIASMYIGVGICIVWSIQIAMPGNIMFFPLIVLPFNFVVMATKRIRYILTEQEQMETLHRFPVLGFLLMWPLLGLLICILVLFGQQPDAIIKAWTQTADWALSTKLPAQALEYDGHYLCTVAAGGHRKVVKPLRYGERHGHRVIVNRQLCVANAFEQLLEERIPVAHRHIRHFYDTYGFPVAKLIKTKFAADVVYILMKPLEWLFLIVLYLFDTKPENRIAVQYLPKKDIAYLFTEKIK